MTARAENRADRWFRRHRWPDLGMFLAILAVAAALRLPDLADRGMWDADQGRHMLDLRSFVLDGQVPLLGPATSIGNFHHGVLYYYLLAPAAALSHGDPVAVETMIALGGVAAVAVVGWLARAIGGPLAGLVAALLLAVSSSAVSQSIFIWNPNLVLLSSSIALAASWQAWQSGGVRWWVVAGAAAITTMQLHILGILLTPVVGALLFADARRCRRAGDREYLGRLGGAVAGWLLIGLVAYVPLIVHELGTEGSEVRGAIAFLTGGGEPASIELPARIVIVGLRVLGWPLTGLITASPAAALLSSALVVALAGALVVRPQNEGSLRIAGRWLAGGLVWTIIGLAVGSASLAVVVPGLANDDYHAFADPMVVTVIAVGLTSIAARGRPGALRAIAQVGATLVVIALVGWNLATQPPSIAPDGGWAAAQASATRVVKASATRPIELSSLPTFKGDEALRMPLEAAGALPLPASTGPSARPNTVQVVLCDQLFRASIGADCGGPAEDLLIAGGQPGTSAAEGRLIDRFTAAPGRWISIYMP